MPPRTYLLFDNSALDHLFGQSPLFGATTRSAVTERLAEGVNSGALAVLVNLALLGELAGLYFSANDAKHDRFGHTGRFIFEAGQGKPFIKDV
jgi:hypothetical protein